ncbi:hypothetical protein ACL2XO_05100 [Sodalis sp. RH15]|uniref:hypothetical protein n=1 Tax=Sodalis sp. RH15 TaxID=3394330 RepID=UPI0039B51D11
MEDSDVDQDIIDKVSAISPYLVWGKNGIIDKIMFWLVLIPIVVGALLVLFYIFNDVLKKPLPQMFGFIMNYLDYRTVAINSLIIYACVVSLFFIFLSCCHGVDVLSRGRKNNEARHNYTLIVQNSKLSAFELNTMKIIVSVNLAKTSNEIKYYIMTGAMFVFLISSWPTLSIFLKLDAQHFFDGIPFPILLSLSLFFLSIVILFGVFIEVQRKNTYALSILESAINYKKQDMKTFSKLKIMQNKY